MKHTWAEVEELKRLLNDETMLQGLFSHWFSFARSQSSGFAGSMVPAFLMFVEGRKLVFFPHDQRNFSQFLGQ